MFAADLVRALHGIDVSVEVDFVSLSSYGDATESSGAIALISDIRADVAGRDVLIVDDIAETGRTLVFVRDMLLERGADRVGIAVLCDKPGNSGRAIVLDHVGFLCPDEFVVGYGMDIGQTYRQLPFIGVVED